MQFFKYIHRYIFGVLLCLPLQVQSQISGSATVYSLDDCLRISTSKNIEILQSSSQFEAQTYQITQAFGQYLPSVNANMGYSRQLNVEGGRTISIGGVPIPISTPPANSYSMSAVASYNIFNGFAREANYSRAQQELNVADFALRRTRQRIAFQIRSQYITVLRSMQIVKIRQENYELGTKELERIKALFDAGRVPIANVLSQETDLGNRELEIVTAENQLNQSKSQLLSTMGLRPDENALFLENSMPSIVEQSTIENFRREIGSQNGAVQKALELRPDLRSNDAIIESAQLQVTQARAGYMPQLGASGGWTWSNTSFDNFSQNGRYFVGMNLSVPVFDNLSTPVQVQQANILVEQRELDRLLTEQRVRTEVQSALINIVAAEKQLDITARGLKSAEQNFLNIQERMKVGVATMIDYITSNTQLVTAKINRANAVYNYFDAQNQVRFAIGLGKE